MSEPRKGFRTSAALPHGGAPEHVGGQAPETADPTERNENATPAEQGHQDAEPDWDAWQIKQILNPHQIAEALIREARLRQQGGQGREERIIQAVGNTHLAKCPHCATDNVFPVPHGHTLRVWEDGLFSCARCGMAGNAKTAPRPFNERHNRTTLEQILNDPARMEPEIPESVAEAIARSEGLLPATLLAMKPRLGLAWQHGKIPPTQAPGVTAGELAQTHGEPPKPAGVTGEHQFTKAPSLAPSTRSIQTVSEAIKPLTQTPAGLTDVAGEGFWSVAIAFPCRETDGTVRDVLRHPLNSAPDGGLRMDGEKPIREPGAVAMPLGMDRAIANADPEHGIILVDHVLDLLALNEAGSENAVALPHAMHPFSVEHPGGDWSILGHIEKAVEKAGHFSIMLRNNLPGHALEDEISRRLGRDHCFRTRWHGQNWADPTQAGALTCLRQFGTQALQDAVRRIEAYPVSGTYSLDDVDDALEFLYEFGLQPGESTGFPSLDEYYTVKEGQITVVTGIPSHGKSNLLDAIMVNIARNSTSEWKFGLFSPENQPIERHYASLMEKYVGAPFTAIAGRERISRTQKDDAKRWLNRHFKVILPDEESGNWSVDEILRLAKSLVYRDGIRGLVIDPWNELDHTRPSAMTETEFISNALTKIRRFARLNGVHVWIVAHPTKMEKRADGLYPVPTPYNISGGAHWNNKADCCITVYRHPGRADQDIVDIHTQKVRFREVGKVGRIALRYSVGDGGYIDDIDQDARTRSLEKGAFAPSVSCRIQNPRNHTPREQLTPVYPGGEWE